MSGQDLGHRIDVPIQEGPVDMSNLYHTVIGCSGDALP